MILSQRLDPVPESVSTRGLPARRVSAMVICGAAALSLSGNVPWKPAAAPLGIQAAEQRASQIRSLVESTTGEQGAILGEGESAVAGNALIPFSGLAIERAQPFHIAAGTPAYDVALKCMTQAIYYEAAREPLAGKRAVAQVVLNRLKHPAYPDSVCGVVYEGSNAPVCQFSFTCDGSLLRQPMTSFWAESRKVAQAALSGFVEPSVGLATHYHADYVLPRWAFTLAKVEQLGRHIFYRFKGNVGRANFLTDHWSGREAIPALDFARLSRELEAQEGLASVEPLTPGLTVTPLVTDRHAAMDVGGRLDVTTQWRPSIPDPVEANPKYRQTVVGQMPEANLALSEDSPTS